MSNNLRPADDSGIAPRSRIVESAFKRLSTTVDSSRMPSIPNWLHLELDKAGRPVHVRLKREAQAPAQVSLHARLALGREQMMRRYVVLIRFMGALDVRLVNPLEPKHRGLIQKPSDQLILLEELAGDLDDSVYEQRLRVWQLLAVFAGTQLVDDSGVDRSPALLDQALQDPQLAVDAICARGQWPGELSDMPPSMHDAILHLSGLKPNPALKAPSTQMLAGSEPPGQTVESVKESQQPDIETTKEGPGLEDRLHGAWAQMIAIGLVNPVYLHNLQAKRSDASWALVLSVAPWAKSKKKKGSKAEALSLIEKMDRRHFDLILHRSSDPRRGIKDACTLYVAAAGETSERATHLVRIWKAAACCYGLITASQHGTVDAYSRYTADGFRQTAQQFEAEVRKAVETWPLVFDLSLRDVALERLRLAIEAAGLPSTELPPAPPPAPPDTPISHRDPQPLPTRSRRRFAATEGPEGPMGHVGAAIETMKKMVQDLVDRQKAVEKDIEALVARSKELKKDESSSREALEALERAQLALTGTR